MSLSSLQSRLEKIESGFNQRANRHITFEKDRTVIHAGDQDKIYIPTPTGKLFHASTGFVDLVIGPYGSGKSTMCAQRIVESTCRMPRWDNGQRRSRWAVVRNTSGELNSTTLQTWLQWFGDLGTIKKRQKPLLMYEHEFNDGHGIVRLELIFIALDRPDDVRKIKSLELTGVYLNELSELPQNVLSHFKGRVNGRFPSRSFCPEPHWSGIIADTNPPDEDHWIFRDFETNVTPSYHVFHQPSGLVTDDLGQFIKDTEGNYIQNIHADNAEHLSADYYPKLAEKQSEGFIKVYCGGKYGLVESGKRVYPEFNYDIHSVPRLDAIQGDPLYLGFDFGLTPACVVVQLTARGQVRILKEYVAEDIGIKTFAENIVIPRLAIDFPYCRISEWAEGDPAGAQGDQIMEELSCIGELTSLGIPTRAATTNDPDVRINSVRYFLNIMVDGKPAFIISREGCPVLVKGFMSGYHFKRMQIGGDERFQEKPNKNKYSHPHDALQYRLMPFASERLGNKPVTPKHDPMANNTVFRWQN
jgi:phage terminase large subunit